MPHPLRLELLRRAREAHRKHGRGYVVLLHDRKLPYYAVTGELEQIVGETPAAAPLLDSTKLAVASYGPEHEAVVVNSTPEGVFVLIVSETEVLSVGSLIWVK